MALSNMRREPRREITESAVGVALTALALYGDYRIALWMHTHDPERDPIPTLAAMALVPLVAAVSVILLAVLTLATHSVGEIVCNKLAEHGVELRPKDRPGRQRYD